jgi:hypothetical protein
LLALIQKIAGEICFILHALTPPDCFQVASMGHCRH